MDPQPTKNETSAAGRAEFQRQAEKPQGSLTREFCALLWQNKKWWLTPIVIALLLIGVLIVLGSTGLAPLIYPLF